MSEKPTYEELQRRVRELEQAESELKQAEAALEESQRRLHTLMSNLPGMAYRCRNSPDWEMEFVSEGCYALTGYQAGAFIDNRSLSYAEIIHPEDRQKVWDEVQAQLVKKRPFKIVYRIVTAAEKERWVWEQGQGIFGPEGNLVALEGFVSDINDLRQAEEELASNYALLRIAGEKAKFGGWIVDLNKNTCTWSEEVADIHEVPRGYVPSVQEGISFYAPEWQETITKVFRRCAEEGIPYDEEMEIITRKGKRLWVRTTGEAVHNEEGEIVKIQGSFQDITRRKRAEEEIQKRDARFRKLAAQAPGLIYQFMLKPDGSMSLPFTTKGVRNFFGCSPEDVRNDFSPIAKVIFPEDLNPLISSIKESARGLTPWLCEYRVQVPGEPIRWMEGHSMPEKMGDGSIIWHGFTTDITARKQAEAEHDTLEAQLRQAQKMESVGRLAGGVAHDFNNMLAIILGYSELAEQNLNSEEHLRMSLKEIRSAAKKSVDITRQLLAFSRKQAISPEVLDLNSTLESMLKMLRRLIGEHIKLAWYPGKSIRPIKMDPSQIDQILVNLCLNARDAIDNMGEIIIETSTSILDETFCDNHPGFVPGEFVTLSVSDDGRGISKDAMEHLFEPFFTTKEMGYGSGLGLATVYGIVKQNNGFIDVHSVPCQGTTVQIYLPWIDAPIDSVHEDNEVGTENRASETVLLVEDEERILKLTKTMLERRGYAVAAFTGTDEAVRFAGEHADDIHVLITDVVMPKMNGLQLAQEIKKACPSIKILYVSGYTADVIAQQGVLDEDAHFLQKPFSQSDLNAKLRKIIDK